MENELAPKGTECYRCYQNCETVPAAYVVDGELVCDSHLDIIMEG